jgi:hypothetical protein
VFGPSGIRTANPEGAASAGGIIGSGEPATEVPFLQKFLQSVEAQREPAEPDSFLLSLLEKGKARHGSSGTTANPAATNTEAAQPAKPQAAKSTAPAEPAAGTSQPVSPPQYSRHRVEIILEKNQLTISDFEAVDTTGWEGEQILAMLLEGLNAELEMQAEEGNAGVAPAVEFLVGSGVDSDLKMLMTELSKIDIPTRSVKPLRHSADPPTAKTTPVLAEPKPKVAPQEPAEPMAPSRPVRAGQGLSI